MKIAISLAVILFFISLVYTQAQTVTEGNFEAGFKGMAAFSFNSRTVAVNLGGPHLDFRITEDVAIGLGAFPSLFFSAHPTLVRENGRNRFEPKLGLGPRVDFKKIVFIAPVYHLSNPEMWLWTFGIGIKI